MHRQRLGILRLEAMKRLGESHIDCLIFEDETKAKKWEISENLHRSDLTKLERDQQVALWIQLTDGEISNASQVATHKKRGQQPEGINAASRELLHQQGHDIPFGLTP